MAKEESSSACPVHHSTETKNDGSEMDKREASSILGRSEDTVWQYPSPKMFINALKKKGKDEGVTEGNIQNVVKLHNSMNEVTWNKILEYEAMNLPSFSTGKGQDAKVSFEELPRLTQFKGRPNDLTPKGWFRSKILGHDLFDRHDWVVSRKVGETVSTKRYVIDYYHKEQLGDGQKSIEVDARPALDSAAAVFSRIKYQTLELLGRKPDISPLVLHKENQQVEQKDIKSEAKCPVDHGKALNQNMDDIKLLTKRIEGECGGLFQNLQNCSSEEECSIASRIVCPNEYGVIQNIRTQGLENLDLTPLQSCLDRFERKAQNVAQN
eukprot:snap_masked-scaffold_20-processed-gene-5.51-mRNA-1 protein AED:0.30 eAED:0.37 QI:0/0/0/0.5/1/1/2/0/323